MRYNSKKICCLAIIILSSALTISWYSPVGEDERNLKVLPKDISSDSLERIMDDFTEALNVNCAFCHAPKDPQQPKKLDYASDANHLKNVTRIMMRMTNEMNNNYIIKLKEKSVQLVTCNTCHRGEATPQVK